MATDVGRGHRRLPHIRTGTSRSESTRLVIDSRPTVTLLAYLLLADGRYLWAAELSRRIWPEMYCRTDLDGLCRRHTIRLAIRRLLRAGCAIEKKRHSASVPSGASIAYRLTAIPPDDLLEATLLQVDAIKARYWR